MSAKDIVDKTKIFLDLYQRKKNDHCALRLVPNKPGLPKLRVRGNTLEQNLVWFHEQNINHDDYRVEILPHEGTIYSATFLVDDNGIIGEIIPGRAWNLTQGIYEGEPPITFSFDYKNWNFSKDKKLETLYIKKGVKLLLISPEQQTKIKEKMQVEFTAEGYLKGYFEMIVYKNGDIYYIDYNRVLGRMLKNYNLAKTGHGSIINGTCASSGQAKGLVRTISKNKTFLFDDGDILVCPMTMVEHIPLMKKAGGIITDQGNILSHAAIVSRELKKPCIVGTKNATRLLNDGDLIFMDADKGTVDKINP